MADRRDAECALLDRYVSHLSVPGYSIDEVRIEGRLALLVLFAALVDWLTGFDPDDLRRANWRSRRQL